MEKVIQCHNGKYLSLPSQVLVNSFHLYPEQHTSIPFLKKKWKEEKIDLKNNDCDSNCMCIFSYWHIVCNWILDSNRTRYCIWFNTKKRIKFVQRRKKFFTNQCIYCLKDYAANAIQWCTKPYNYFIQIYQNKW